MVLPPNSADFGFRIDFAKNTEDPARVFRAFSGLIDFCQVTNEILIQSLDLDVESDLLVSDIQQGSIIVWFKNVLKYYGNNSKHLNLTLINNYLVQARFLIVKDREKISSKQEFLDLKNTLLSLSSNNLNIDKPLPDEDLLRSIDKLQLPLSELNAADKLYCLTRSSSQLINQDFRISEEARDNLLVRETKEEEESEMILKVEKLGPFDEFKWKFKYRNENIEAKIMDLD